MTRERMNKERLKGDSKLSAIQKAFCNPLQALIDGKKP